MNPAGLEEWNEDAHLGEGTQSPFRFRYAWPSPFPRKIPAGPGAQDLLTGTRPRGTFASGESGIVGFTYGAPVPERAPRERSKGRKA